MAFTPKAGEPWRAHAQLLATSGAANGTVNWTPSPAGVGDDLSPWEGDPGATLTTAVSSSFPAGFLNPPNKVQYAVAVPGGAAVGAVRTLTLDANGNGNVNVSIRLDSDPMAASVANAIRSGLLELYVKLIRDSDGTGATNWTADTRGAVSGVADGATPSITGTRARGYLRSRCAPSLLAQDNDSGFTGEPGLFAYPDPVFLRCALSTDTWAAMAVTQAVRDSLGDVRSAASPVQTAATRDTALTAVSGLAGRVNADYDEVGAHTHRVLLPASSFGGTPDGGAGPDYDFAWTDTPAIGVRVDDRTLDLAGALSVDARLTPARWLQLDKPTYAAPPVDDGPGSGYARQTSEEGFVAVKFVNARGEPQQLSGAGLGVDYLLRDKNSVVRYTRTDEPTDANGLTPLRSWADQLPGGAWRITDLRFTDQAGDQALTATTLPDYVLLSRDPQLVLVSGAGVLSNPPDHFMPGQPLTVGAALRNRFSGLYAPVDASPAPSVVLLRLYPTAGGGKGQFLAADGTTWTDLIVGGVEQAAYAHPLTQSADDPNIWTVTFADTGGWGYLDMFVIATVYHDGTPYNDDSEVPALGLSNRHSGYAFDPTGLFK